MEVAEVIENENLFEKVIAQGNVYLKLVGLELDSRDEKRRFIERLRFRRLFIFTFAFICMDVSGQLTWLIGSAISGNGDLIDVTFVVPCLTITLMGSVKCFYFLKNVNLIHEIIGTLRKLKVKRLRIRKKHDGKFENTTVHFLYTANKIISWATILTLITFGVGPLLSSATIFYNTGEIKLFFPFIFYYPFDAYDIRIWPFLYVQQLWYALVEVCTIWGPDYVRYAVSTYIIIYFFFLKQDIVCLIRKSRSHDRIVADDEYRVNFKEIVECHNDLLRCAGLMEVAYTKTILLNVICSSVLICFNVFNITANINIVLMAPYTAFLAAVLGQIFLLCHFGDMIMRSSMEISDAIYKCQWYRADSSIVRDLIIMSLRASKPSKLTAYGYSDVSLRTFTKILKTSWSYLALLQTVYNRNKAMDSTT